jgi:hypothetical protein
MFVPAFYVIVRGFPDALRPAIFDCHSVAASCCPGLSPKIDDNARGQS